MNPRTVPPWIKVAAVLGLLFALVIAALMWRMRPRLTSEEAREVVTAALQRETREAFVITGALDITVHTRVENVRRFLGMSLGSVEAQVRAPGRVSYGFPLAALRAEDIQVTGDTIVMQVPDPRVYAVEPRLEDMEIETRSGWLRVREDTEGEVQQRATQLIGPALRNQAAQHLRDSQQPRINTAETLHDLLRPAFAAAGVTQPVFRFIVSETVHVYGERDR